MLPSHSGGLAAAVLFDLDGTLVDSAPSLTRGLNEIARRRGTADVEIVDVRRWISLGGETMLRGALGDRVNMDCDLDEFRDILRSQTADPSDLFPGVVETLRQLKAKGIATAICTNKREDIAVPYADGLGIARYFDAIVGGAPGRKLKPDPSIVELTLQRLGSNCPKAIFVGDSEVDAATAFAANMPFVLVEFGYPTGPLSSIACTRRISRFDDLVAAVGEMTDAG